MPGTTRIVITPNPQPDAPLTQLPPDILGEVTKRLSNEAMGRLSQTCRLFHASFQETMRTIELQQAVLDGNIPVIQRILDIQPELLLQEPKRRDVIQSQLTEKKVFGEMPFAMALKTRQNKVIKAMLPYIGKIDNGQQKALALWDAIDMMPVKAPYDFKYLLDVIAQETYPNGFEGKLSDATEQALEAFKDSVNPQEAIDLKDDYDVLEHLNSAYKAFDSHFNQHANWQTWGQMGIYATRVLGELQSVLQRENGEVYCHGLYEVSVKNEKPTSDRARDLKLRGGDAFYRGRGGQGLGIDIYCSFGEGVAWGPGGVRGDQYLTVAFTLFKSFLEETKLSSAILKGQLSSSCWTPEP